MNDEKSTGVHVWLVLMKSWNAISKLVNLTLGEYDLGESDFRVLEALLHKGPLPVNSIGPKVNLTPGSISTAVERLNARGLVRREEIPTDRRIKIVSLTANGQLLIQDVFDQHAAIMERAAGVLSSEERIELESLLKKFGRNAELLTTDLGKSP